MKNMTFKKITSQRLFLPIFCLALVLLVNIVTTPNFCPLSVPREFPVGARKWTRRERAARGGHSVPYEDVIRRFARSLENLPKAIALADKATILDNSTQGYRLIQVAK